MSMFPHTAHPQIVASERNPFEEFDAALAMASNELPPGYWQVDDVDHAKYKPAFQSLEPYDGIVSGAKVKPVLMETRLPNHSLADIWRLSDYDSDGAMDLHQFSI